MNISIYNNYSNILFENISNDIIDKSRLTIVDIFLELNFPKCTNNIQFYYLLFIYMYIFIFT